MNDIIYSIVENGYNTCYIDTLLVSLFYKNNENFNLILEKEPSKPEGYYLQELIKIKFIEPIRRNYSINSSIINEIRNYSIICGWSNDLIIDGQKKCSDYYNFIYKLFNIESLEFEIINVLNYNNDNNIKKINYPYITLNLYDNDTIKNLLLNWININIKNIITLKSLNCYKLINIPQFVIIHINRLDNNIRNKYKLDIMKQIKFFGINDIYQKTLKWKIYSIICYKGDTYDNGHYYSIINMNNDNWLLFDDTLIPSFEIIDLELDTVKNKIMSEVDMIIYSL